MSKRKLDYIKEPVKSAELCDQIEQCSIHNVGDFLHRNFCESQRNIIKISQYFEVIEYNGILFR